MSLKEIAKLILKSNTIAIFTHVNPDCDAFGSAFSLEETLSTQFNKRVDVFSDGNLNNYNEKIIFEGKNICEENFDPKKYDLLIMVDSSSAKRLGKYIHATECNNMIKIDHHEGDDGIVKKSYIDSHSSSCSELIYLLLTEMKAKITAKIATYIYAGISTDTYCFMEDNTTKRSLEIASKMIAYGANNIFVNHQCYKKITPAWWEMTKYFYNNVEILDNFAIIIIDSKTIKNMGVKSGDYSKFASEMIKIEGIKLACLLTQTGINSWRGHLRSKEDVRVDLIANNFDGGGHRQASGFLISGNKINVKEKVVIAIREALRNGDKK